MSSDRQCQRPGYSRRPAGACRQATAPCLARSCRRRARSTERGCSRSCAKPIDSAVLAIADEHAAAIAETSPGWKVPVTGRHARHQLAAGSQRDQRAAIAWRDRRNAWRAVRRNPQAIAASDPTQCANGCSPRRQSRDRAAGGSAREDLTVENARYPYRPAVAGDAFDQAMLGIDREHRLRLDRGCSSRAPAARSAKRARDQLLQLASGSPSTRRHIRRARTQRSRAAEIGDEAARFAHQQDARRDVPQVEIVFPEAVQPPGRDPGEIERGRAEAADARDLRARPRRRSSPIAAKSPCPRNGMPVRDQRCRRGRAAPRRAAARPGARRPCPFRPRSSRR